MNMSFRRVFLLSVCLTVFSFNSFANIPGSPSNEQRYFKEVALKWGNLANQSQPDSDSPAVLKAGIFACRSSYRVDTGDVLTLTIPNMDLLSPLSLEQLQKTQTQMDITVDQNGEITLPSFGTYKVAGLSNQQINAMITEMARYYLTDPKVYLTLKSTRPFSVYVRGEVRHPGAYQVLTSNASGYQVGASLNVDAQEVYSPKITVLIKKAGGILPTSDLEHVTVDNEKTGKHLTLNLKKMILEGDSLQDILLEPNDVVSLLKSNANNNKIPEIATSTLSPDKYVVKILGFVNRVGLGTLELDSRSMTVINALNTLTIDPDVNLRNIIILRQEPGKENYTKLKVDVTKKDFALEPDDTILVTHKRIGAKIRQFAQTILSPAAQASAGVGFWR